MGTDRRMPTTPTARAFCPKKRPTISVRTEALMGAELILIPTVNTKAEPSEMFEWELKVQAFHSSVFIAMCNRVGTEGDMDFSGESIVVDPNGDTVIKADDTEQLVYADIDLPKATNIRRHRPYKIGRAHV